MIHSNQSNTCSRNCKHYSFIGRFIFWVVAIFIFLSLTKTKAFSQQSIQQEKAERLVYVEIDPFAYINKGYSVHLGYEDWGLRFDLTKVKVDFPESFEDAFYSTKAFDLVTHINGIKVDYIGNRTNWTKGAFIGLDINHQRLDLTHRASLENKNLTTFNIGIRAGYKINLFKGFYITPWAAVWKNVAGEQSFETSGDLIKTNEWDWITTLHLGYAYKF